METWGERGLMKPEFVSGCFGEREEDADEAGLCPRHSSDKLDNSSAFKKQPSSVLGGRGPRPGRWRREEPLASENARMTAHFQLEGLWVAVLFTSAGQGTQAESAEKSPGLQAGEMWTWRAAGSQGLVFRRRGDIWESLRRFFSTHLHTSRGPA